MTNKSKAVGEPVWQVWDGDTCSWHDVTPEYYAERLPSNRRILYTAAPTPSATKCVTGEYADCGNDFGCAGCVEPSSAQPPISAKVEDTGEPVALPKDVLDALRFYAHGHHYEIDDSQQQFDTVSGEPANWMFSEKDDDCTMFEDGGIARAVLMGRSAGFEEPVEPLEGEVFVAAPRLPNTTPSTQAVGEPTPGSAPKTCKPGGCSAIGCEGGHYCFDENGVARPASDPGAVARAIFPNLPASPAESVLTFFEVGTTERGSALNTAIVKACQSGFARGSFQWCSVFADALAALLAASMGGNKS